MAVSDPSEVQTLVQQMQDKFQTMSDQIINRNILCFLRIDDIEKNIGDLMSQAKDESTDPEQYGTHFANLKRTIS
uniref:Heat shock factor-binding protein 1 n=1 Tax=Eptatretus burgeri TaxID=7764 RepID=A0A8C4QBQ0_EPTBU